MKFERAVVQNLCDRLRKGPPLIQILIGARQVGKTTSVHQAIQKLGFPQVFAAADTPLPQGAEWIETHWLRARILASQTKGPVILALDEIQKIRSWSEGVKRLWDEDRRQNISIHVILLGSSALLLQQGVVESLAGRFFLHRCPHWSWDECRQAFGWSLSQWIYYGGYPGSARLISHPQDWRQYVTDSLIETVLARDVLQLQTVNKPALLRHLFALAAGFPAQIFSFNKMLGQLQDAGNTTTLAHYLKLLETAFLVSGLELYSVGQKRKRGSSPKLILWNQALINALSGKDFKNAHADISWWGRLVENAVGAHLLNQLPGVKWDITYWREGNEEVDFVVSETHQAWALEVKSGRSYRISGLEAFRKRYPKAKALLIGSEGIPLEEFFSSSPEAFLK